MSTCVKFLTSASAGYTIIIITYVRTVCIALLPCIQYVCHISNYRHATIVETMKGHMCKTIDYTWKL